MKKYWGFGYATEAADEALNYAFNVLYLNEVVAFTILKKICIQRMLPLRYANIEKVQLG